MRATESKEPGGQAQVSSYRTQAEGKTLRGLKAIPGRVGGSQLKAQY